jgi:hypothetical protein
MPAKFFGRDDVHSGVHRQLCTDKELEGHDTIQGVARKEARRLVRS